MTVVVAHGGTGGAIAEALFLAVPVVVFVVLSRWAKRKARALEAEGPIDGAGVEGGRGDEEGDG